MPVPVKADIKKALRASFIASGNFPKHDDEGNVIEGLPDGLEQIIDAQAEGIAAFWLEWQTSQLVTVPAITTGPSVATGTLTP